MFDIQEYYEMNSIMETKEFLEKNPNAVLIAGGTDMLIKLREGKLSEVTFAGINRIAELKKIAVDDEGMIIIGPTVTFKQLENDDIIKKHIPFLGEAGGTMGGPQMRNVATIGGNICNGATSADSASMLCCLNAKLCIESAENTRIIPLVDFYRGPGKVDLNSGELLTAILIEKQNYQGYYGKYIKFSQRRAMDIASLGCSVVVKVNKNYFEDVRIAYGVAAPTPVRCPNAEKTAIGMKTCEENIKAISEAALLDVSPRDSWRASKAFREHLVKEISKKALAEAVIRSGGDVIA